VSILHRHCWKDAGLDVGWNVLTKRRANDEDRSL
jgi:hypothetical protein